MGVRILCAAAASGECGRAISPMAEFLIKAVDANNPDPATDRGCWKRGHPVVVMEDGHLWGQEEGLPTFFILKVPDLTAAAARQYLADHRIPATVAETRRWRADDWAQAQARGWYQEFGTTAPTAVRTYQLVDLNGNVHEMVDLSGFPLQLQARRLWRLDVASLPAARRNQLFSTGSLTIQWSQIRTFLKNQVTGTGA